MSSRFERTVQFFDISLTGHTRSRDLDPNHKKFASPKTLDELLTHIEVIRELGQARKKSGTKSKYQFALEHIENRDDCWILLINLVDSNAANVVTNRIDGSEADRHTIEFNDDQGLESSAHLVIFKETNKLGKHLMLFEKSQHVPFQKASAFLNHLAAVAARHFRDEYVKPHPSGNPAKEINTYCKFSLFAHPSDEFKEELRTGTLTGIRLTSDTVLLRGYDAKAQPELVGTEVKVDVTRWAVARSGGNMKHLKKALAHANELDVPFVRVSFEDETGSSHTATLSTDTGMLMNKDRYVKKRKIRNFSVPLATAVPVINEEITQKMIELRHA